MLSLGKPVFYAILAVCLGLVILLVADGLVNAFSVDSLNDYLQNNGYSEANNNVGDGEKAFRLTVIIRLVVNAIVIIFFAVYSYFAHAKRKAGYVYTVFWAFVLVGNILGAWLIPGSSLPFKIIATVLSVGGLAALFAHFVALNQHKFYKDRSTRWGKR